MSKDETIQFTGAVTAARNGDEDAYEFLYNAGLKKCRAIGMEYFDPATAAGRKQTDDVVRETFLRVYDRLAGLREPQDYPDLCAGVARDVARQFAMDGTVQLVSESYIDVTDEQEQDDQPALVTAEECRAEVRGDNILSTESIGLLTLAILHRLTPAQRLAVLRWNENDDTPMKTPDLLREAFIAVEKAVMDIEKAHDIRAKDFAHSRLAFFNWLLDLYGRSYEAVSATWDDAVEPDYARTLADDEPEEDAEDEAEDVTFHEVWDQIRAEFYIQNTMELPDLSGEEYADYLDGNAGDDTADFEAKPKKKRWFLATKWGRLLVTVLILVLVIAGLIATAGQHTSHALEASVQIADSALEQVYVFNIS